MQHHHMLLIEMFRLVKSNTHNLAHYNQTQQNSCVRDENLLIHVFSIISKTFFLSTWKHSPSRQNCMFIPPSLVSQPSNVSRLLFMSTVVSIWTDKKCFRKSNSGFNFGGLIITKCVLQREPLLYLLCVNQKYVAINKSLTSTNCITMRVLSLR